MAKEAVNMIFYLSYQTLKNVSEKKFDLNWKVDLQAFHQQPLNRSENVHIQSNDLPRIKVPCNEEKEIVTTDSLEL